MSFIDPAIEKLKASTLHGERIRIFGQRWPEQ